MLVALRNHTAVIIPDGGAEADCIEWFLLFCRFADVFHTNAAALPWIRREGRPEAEGKHPIWNRKAQPQMNDHTNTPIPSTTVTPEKIRSDLACQYLAKARIKLKTWWGRLHIDLWWR